MKNILYLECYSGISGDMTVAALLDLGADEAVLRKVLKSIPVTGFKTKISRVKKEGLAACDFEVVLDKVHENHDHDMEYLYGKRLQESGHQSQKEHRHPVHQAHEHRGLKEVLHIIEQSEATDRAKETAAKIFRILAEAEAKAHGTSVEEVHFHEVGAVDSIVDVLAAAVCLDNLDVEQVIVSRAVRGTGKYKMSAWNDSGSRSRRCKYRAGVRNHTASDLYTRRTGDADRGGDCSGNGNETEIAGVF